MEEERIVAKRSAPVLYAASDNHLRRGNPWQCYIMLAGNGQDAPHREMEKGGRREERWLLLEHTLNVGRAANS